MQKYSLENLKKISKRLKKRKKIIGLCHGVFDVIHAGHINLFEEVNKNCDYNLLCWLRSCPETVGA